MKKWKNEEKGMKFEKNGKRVNFKMFFAFWGFGCSMKIFHFFFDEESESEKKMLLVKNVLLECGKFVFVVMLYFDVGF